MAWQTGQRIVSAFRLLLCTALLTGCTKDRAKVNRGNYPDEIGKIITLSCAQSGCHNNESYKAAGNYNLQTWSDMFKGAGSGNPVIPYNSKFSSLCYYINTYPELGLQNVPTMPLNKPALTYTEVKKIKDWIDAGAPDINGQVMWADNPQLKKLYAVNQGCDVVTVFDSKTRLPIRYIDVGTKPGSPDTPHQIRVSPDGAYWYVVFINNNVMQKFRCSDDSYVGTIPLTPVAAGTSTNPLADAADWNTFVITRDGKRAYAVSWSTSGKVAAVDLEKRTLLHYAPAFYEPHGIALNAAEDKVYITAQVGNYITECDTGFQNRNELSLQEGLAPSQFPSLNAHDILLAPNGVDLLITCQLSNEVRVYNTQTKKVTNIINTGVYPQEIVYSRGTASYYISCTYDSTMFRGSTGVITRISANGYQASHIACGFQPHGMAVDEANALLYVLSRNGSSNGPQPHHTSVCSGRNGFASFVDLSNFTVLPGRVELSVDPYFIFARP